MKRLVMLLVGAFVGISVAVALVPLVTGIVLTDITNPVALAVATVARWLIPLAAVVALVMLGVRGLRRGSR